MIPEDRAKALADDLRFAEFGDICGCSECMEPLWNPIASAIRSAENAALERAAQAVGPNPYYAAVVERIRALKTEPTK
jgi:hypothetical protein